MQMEDKLKIYKMNKTKKITDNNPLNIREEMIKYINFHL
jgi:hypothetical protein